MKNKKLLSLGLMGLVTLLSFNLSSGQVVKAATSAAGDVGVTYRGHVQNIGWQDYVSDGAEAGTDGKGYRVEALNIKLVNAPQGAHIQYQGHVQNIGWQQVVSDGAEIGTDGQGLRVEAFKLALTGMPGYSIQYRAHVQNIGWQPWVSDGAEAGTDGMGLRVEALEIRVVKTTDGSTPTPAAFVNTDGTVLAGLGQTVTIPDSLFGTYEMTINNVQLVSERNQFDSINPVEVYKINYTYKLLAKGSATDVGLFLAYPFESIDSTGKVGYPYPDTVINEPQELNVVGSRCNADTFVGVDNATTSLTLLLNYDTPEGTSYKTFNIPTK